MSSRPPSFVFFGTDEFSVIILEELKKARLVPRLIVTAPDRPKGRGLAFTPPPVKIWAKKNNIKLLQPEKLDSVFVNQLSGVGYQLFVITFYGKILPKEVLDIPLCGAINVHPSLLPLYRGPAPEQQQILDGVSKTGVTIILADEKMDHGPIVAQKEVELDSPYIPYKELRKRLALEGGQLLAKTIPEWVVGNRRPQEQDHAKATYTRLLKKEDGLINLDDDPELNYRKFLAYNPWPGVYFFHNGKRVKVTDAELARSGLGSKPDLEFVVKKVIPEGKKEVAYKNFK